MPASPWRVGVALGDPDRVHALVTAFEVGDELAPVRSRTAPALLALVQTRALDVAVVGTGLHGLDAAAREILLGSGVRLVVLGPPEAAQQWPGLVLQPPETPAAEVRAAVLAAVRKLDGRPRPAAAAALGTAAPAASDAERAGQVVVVAGAHGAPGRTTMALNLAAALGAAAPTCLVELDVAAPALSLLLEVDPTHHVALLRHRDPRTPAAWERALGQEWQPLDPVSRQGRVLLGVPTPEQRAALGPEWCRQLLAELRARLSYVVVDVGAELLEPGLVVQRIALQEADVALLVARPDVVAVRRAQRLALLARDGLGLPETKLFLTVNGYDEGRDDPVAKVVGAIGLPLAAIIPQDADAMRRALALQRPAVTLGRGPAARALLDLADRLYGARIALPSNRQTGRTGRWPWRRAASSTAPLSVEGETT